MTEAELAVLELLWTESPRTARQLTELLYPPGTPSDVATVQKLLQRLEAKQLVERDRTQRVHAFAAAVSREAYAGSRLADLAERLSDGSFAPLLLHLVSTRRLTAQELIELRRVLDDAPKTRKGRP
ncbi:MAG: BlaI/MecI/CopY family transcriptional regulator [Planctomycetaceae bacterium]|nr:BlaI/MecI/CopY family transcriptional regulator [Planctomycetaceae bacterium]